MTLAGVLVLKPPAHWPADQRAAGAAQSTAALVRPKRSAGKALRAIQRNVLERAIFSIRMVIAF